jgi:hypothetical protein
MFISFPVSKVKSQQIVCSCLTAINGLNYETFKVLSRFRTINAVVAGKPAPVLLKRRPSMLVVSCGRVSLEDEYIREEISSYSTLLQQEEFAVYERDIC